MIYLLIINILSFLIYFLKIKFLIIIFSILGGSIGELINIILFDKKSNKQNMMNKLFIVCMFIIQIILIILIKNKTINFNIFKILNNKYLLIYLFTINTITFIVFYLDKQKAIKNKWRFKITTLLSLSCLGGSLGAILAIYIFKHKTKVNYFTKGIPLIMIVHLLIILLLTNI